MQARASDWGPSLGLALCVLGSGCKPAPQTSAPQAPRSARTAPDEAPPSEPPPTREATSTPSQPSLSEVLARGLAAENAKDYATADVEYQRLLALVEHGDARDDVMVVLASLSRTKYELGDLDASLDCTQRALAIAREIPDHEFTTELLIGLGHIREARGEHDEAREAWTQAAEQLEARGEVDRAAKIRERLAALDGAGAR